MIKKIEITILLILIIFIIASSAYAAPLSVYPSNSRYFTDGTGKAIYLTGSHTWGNLVDYPPDEWSAFDWNGYLDFLQQKKHNFIRLWTADTLGRTPSRYVLNTSGKADLNQLNQAYFDRLRERIISAGQRGIFVGIMLFRPDDGAKAEDWPYNYFNSSNNINGINGDTNGDGRGLETYNLSVPAITNIQETYVKKVIDTVNDLDNVLYEIGNEGDLTSGQWQQHMVNFIKNYEAGKPKKHPVGMTAVFNIPTVVTDPWVCDDSALWNSSADWISPCSASYKNNPPVATGNKVTVSDVDHVWPTTNPRHVWIWQSFMRGMNPILMDWYTYGAPPSWWIPGATEQERIAEQDKLRIAMGRTLDYSKKINLASMIPSSSSSDCSTTYCLRNPGNEYLVYQPGSGAFSVNLQAGTYTYEWYNTQTGVITQSSSITANGTTYFTPAYSEALLYLELSSAVNNLPTGNFDTADSSKAVGWAYDKDAGASPVTVQIYVDGVLDGSTVANLSRPDLVTAGVAPDPYHGFSYNFSNLSTGTHTVRAYAVNIPTGTNPELTGSPKTITVSQPSTGPIAWWKFDETGGTSAFDSSGSGITATLYNGASFVTGRINNAVSLDGMNDYVSAPDTSSLNFGTGNFSISLWFKTNDINATLINKGETQGYLLPDYWEFWIDSSGKLTFYTAENDINTEFKTAVSYNNSVWHHAVAYRNGTTVGIYVDGASQGSATGTIRNVSQDTNRPLGIGASYYSPYGGFGRNLLLGSLDQIRIYNRALSAEEVQTLYQEGASDTTPPSPPTNVVVS